MQCPKCSGAMWDNRQTKRKPTQPDYKCKDKQNCDGAVWLDRQQNGNAPQSNGNGAAPAPKSGVFLDVMMYRCHEQAIAICVKLHGDTVPVEVIATCAHSLFIARMDGKGILKAEAKPAPPPPPPPPPPAPEPLPEYVDFGSELPF